MLDRRQNELKDLLKEGATALIEMRKGIENACAELRTLYSNMIPRHGEFPKQRNRGEGQRKQSDLKRQKEVSSSTSY